MLLHRGQRKKYPPALRAYFYMCACTCVCMLCVCGYCVLCVCVCVNNNVTDIAKQPLCSLPPSWLDLASCVHPHPLPVLIPPTSCAHPHPLPVPIPTHFLCPSPPTSCSTPHPPVYTPYAAQPCSTDCRGRQRREHRGPGRHIWGRVASEGRGSQGVAGWGSASDSRPWEVCWGRSKGWGEDVRQCGYCVM